MKQTLAVGLLIPCLALPTFSGVLPTEAVAKKKAKILPTDDVTIIAWVDPAPISLATDGVSPSLFLTLAQPGLCDGLLNSWANGNRSLINSAEDVRYANAFLLKNSPNSSPAATINPATVEQAGDYRLFHRFQAAYRVKDGKVIGTPKAVRGRSLVGTTPDPCQFSPIFASGDNHQSNGAIGASVSGAAAFQINEGRIGNVGQMVDRTLNACSQSDCASVPVGPTTPWIWSVIRFDNNGDVLPVDRQIFPTYSVYLNGARTSILPQSAPEPFISLDATSQRLPGEVP